MQCLQRFYFKKNADKNFVVCFLVLKELIRNLQVEPEISSTGEDGIHTARVMGQHDSDYFIEITAVNKAMLQTVHTLQVCCF